MKKRISALLILFCIIFSFCSFASVSVDYTYSESVTSGTIRYVSQISTSDVFYPDYWGKFAGYAHNECGTASISMALSAIGIDKTPEDLGNYWISKGYTWGVPFSTVLSDVPQAQGGETYDFEMAFKRYIDGGGAYSPVIIYFTAATNPNRTGNRHFVVVTEKNEDGSYNAVNPSDKDMLNLRIDKNSYGTLSLKVFGKKGTTQGDVTEYEFRSAQYYNPNFVAPETKPEIKEDTATNEETPKEETLKEETKKVPAISRPDLVFPIGKEASDATALPSNVPELRFLDTGDDTYTLHIRKATSEGKDAPFNDSEETLTILTFTIGDGFTVRNQDGTISVFLKDGLSLGYLYRFYVKCPNGTGSTLSAYGIAAY